MKHLWYLLKEGKVVATATRRQKGFILLPECPDRNTFIWDNEWVLDEQKVKKEEFEQVCAALDEVTEQLLHNDARYGNLAKYTESYLTRKEELVEKQAELVLVLETLLEEIEDDRAE